MNDTTELLQRCRVGVVTAVNSFSQVMGNVQNRELRGQLQQSKKRHQTLGRQIDEQLEARHVNGRDLGPMARAGVWMTTEMRMMTDRQSRDHQIARLVTNGCNTGIQAVSRDVNRLTGAEGESVKIAQSLVKEEQKLMEQLRSFL